MICWRLIAKLTAWRTRGSAHGSFLPGLSVICSSRKAAFRLLSTCRLLSLRSDRATSTDSVAPSMAPARRAATRACSSVITFIVIASMYGWPGFQKLSLRTSSTRSSGVKPTILYGPVPIAFRLTLIWS